MIWVETPRRQRVRLLVSWGHWFSLFNIFIALIISSVYVFTSDFPSTGMGTLYMLSTWFGHIAFVTFMGFILLVLPLCYLVSSERAMRAYGASITAFGLAILAFDALLYNKVGVHISLGAADVIRSETATVMANFSWQQWGFLVLLFLVWLGFQLILGNALWKRLDRLQQVRVVIPIVAFFTLCFTFSHSAHIWADARLYRPIIEQDDMFPLSYPATAKTLMSRYGILDMANYRQRKSLQLNTGAGELNYPTAPMYCTVKQARPLAVFLVDDIAPLENQLSTLGMTSKNNHFGFSESVTGSWLTLIYGLPGLFEGRLPSPPVLLDLAASFNLNTRLLNGVDDNSQRQWQQLANSPLSYRDLVLAQGSYNDVAPVVNQGFVDAHNVIIAQRYAPMGAPLYTNVDMSLNQAYSSHEDLAPTILDIQGCDVNAGHYSTGRSLFSRNRNWVVSSYQNNVIIIKDEKRIIIDASGQHVIQNVTTGVPSADTELDLGLVRQAMQLLSGFLIR